MKLAQLEKIGLKEKEAKIYVALLKEGESLANQLAKKTNILRASVYDYLDILLDKGFISYNIKSGKKYFQAVDPQKILDNFEERKRIEEESLKEIIPELESFKGMSDKKVNIQIFEGKEGMKSVMSKVLKENPKEILTYGSSGVSYRILPFFMEHWHNERIKRKIPLKIIYSNTSESKDRIKKGPSIKYMDIKFMPIENFSLTGNLIYNNTVLITMWNPETPFAISITGEEIVKSYKDNFEVLWKIAKK